jgi:regulatory protein
MEITKISVQARNPERVNLYVDGKFYRGLDRLVALKLGLKSGLTLNPRLIDNLETTQSENSAWEWALRSLQVSPKSIRDMRMKLKRKFEPELVESIMKKLENADLLNDERFAERLVGDLARRGTKSKKEISLKLRQKGIADDIAKKALGQVDSETDSVLKLTLAKNRGLREDLPWRERYEKIVSYLARKGFSYADIRRVVTKENLDLNA